MNRNTLAALADMRVAQDKLLSALLDDGAGLDTVRAAAAELRRRASVLVGLDDRAATPVPEIRDGDPSRLRRVSVVDGDPGYVPLGVAARMEVFLNGRQVERCITADADLGVVLVYVDDQSQACRWIDGEVEILFRRDGAA